MPRSFQNRYQIDPKKLRKKFWNGLRKIQKYTLESNSQNLVNLLKTNGFSFLFVFRHFSKWWPTWSEMWSKVDLELIPNQSKSRQKSILKMMQSLNAVWHWFLVDFDRSGEEKWDAQGGQKGPTTQFFLSLFVLGGSWGPLGSFGGLVGAKITFKTSQEAA